MPINGKEELFRSNRKTVRVVKIMLCISMVVVVAIGVSSCFSNNSFFPITILILLPVLFVFLLIVFMMKTVKNYEISEYGIQIEEINIPWDNVVSLFMPFQSRIILILIYKRRNKRKYVTLIANAINDKSSFIPKTLRYDFQTELEKYIRLKIKQEKGSGLFS